MDVREKLVEILRKPIFPHELVDPIEAVADYLLDSGVTVQEWISVKDRLPEDICPVLVALEGLNIAFHGFYQDEKWWTVGAGTRPFTQKVTHWMPLPQPPKGEAK